jgi:hypothetical protein
VSIALKDMKSSLLTVEKAQEVLAASEPLVEYPLDTDNTRFLIEDAWNHGLDAKDGSDLVDAAVILGGHEVQLSKDALLQATSLCGLTSAYVKRTPAKLIEPHLNYWYGEQGIGNRPAKLLVTNGNAAAVTRQSIVPFSNLKLLSRVLDGLDGEEVYVDSKFHHSVAGTYLRLVLPSRSFVVQDTGVDDDEWLMGISLYNSLTGKGKTSINGYLFRWWCLNGAIDTKATSGTWTRSMGNGDSSDVYDWAAEVVGSVVSSLEDSPRMLQDMVGLSIEGDVSQILQDLFEDYKLPARDRKAIIANMVEDDELTMYSLMQSVTEVANSMDITPDEQAKLMSVGGDLTVSAAHRCGSCHRITKG